MISVQVLNEVHLLKVLCPTCVPLGVATNASALILAAALEAGCTAVLTEDMHHGLVVDGVLTVTNPFR